MSPRKNTKQIVDTRANADVDASAYSRYNAASYGRGGNGRGGRGGRGNGGYESASYGSASYGNGGAKAKAGMSAGKQVAISILLILLTFGIIAGTVVYLFMQQVNQNLGGSYSEEQKMSIAEQLVATTTADEPFYVMLIGSDERADDESMGARSDTNILVRVDPTTWTITMVSIPRDTKITFNGSTTRFNTAYTYGDGAAGVIQATKELCGVNISHYVEVNFDGVVALVDALGGVEVDVPQALNDPQAGWATIDQPGLQTLSGAQALVFARSRHYYMDGDFSRTQSQRALIEAMVNKILAQPVGELPGLIQKMAACVSTDMSVMDILSLAVQYKNSGAQMTIYNAMVPSTAGMEGDIAYVIADTQGLADMMELVKAGKDPATVELSSGAVISGGYQHYDYIEGLEE